MEIINAGADSLLVKVNDDDLEQANDAVVSLVAVIKKLKPLWLKALIPSYDTVLISFDCYQSDHLAVDQFLRSLPLVKPLSMPSKRLSLPVYYDPPTYSDLGRICDHCKLSAEEVIALHCQQVLRVLAIGFASGFAYLGELPRTLSVPPLSTPRQQVPAGTVAIADQQSVVYPMQSPSDWNVLGLCPLLLFQPTEAAPIPFKVGDRLKFRSISEEEYQHLLAQQSQ